MTREQLKQVLEEWVAAGLVEKRRRPDGTVEYRRTKKGMRLGDTPPLTTTPAKKGSAYDPSEGQFKAAEYKMAYE